MKTKTNTKAGLALIPLAKANHNESMKVRSNVKAGIGSYERMQAPGVSGGTTGPNGI